jgi:transcriptional regulator with XRE-family HTH domain
MEVVHVTNNNVNRIAILLKEKNMTQKYLAQLSGVTESAISHYIKGDRIPRGLNLLKIAKTLGTTTDYLLEDYSPNSKNDLQIARSLLARNASNMTFEEKEDFLRLLFGGEKSKNEII